MAGRLFAVVGPSGAGKDTLLLAAVRARPDLVLVRRVVTRPEEAGGEPFEGVSEAEFEARRASGGFALDWCAHGLRYGIPAGIETELAEGRDVVFNGSRAMIDAARERYPDLRVILVTASPETLAARLAARGRESAEDIKARLDRASHDTAALGAHDVVENDGALDDAVAAFLALLEPERV